jgi:hypothetical protein
MCWHTYTYIHTNLSLISLTCISSPAAGGGGAAGHRAVRAEAGVPHHRPRPLALPQAPVPAQRGGADQAVPQREWGFWPALLMRGAVCSARVSRDAAHNLVFREDMLSLHNRRLLGTLCVHMPAARMNACVWLASGSARHLPPHRAAAESIHLWASCMLRPGLISMAGLNVPLPPAVRPHYKL